MANCRERSTYPICSSGRRATFYYPGGGTYSGHWLCNKRHGWGIKTSPKRTSEDFANKKVPNGQLVYEGEWFQNKRHGSGSMLRKHGPELKLIYAGHWYEGEKCGEGKQIYPDGCVYFGKWQKSQRHGIGIQWYATGDNYVGEWESDLRHGLGVHIYANGNRYEGHFARGYKNGEGVFYHMHTGQIQKGMWENDNAKTSLMQDEAMLRRNDKPTPYPIPVNCLKYPNEIIRELFQRYKVFGDRIPRPFNDKMCLKFIHRNREFATLEQRFASPTMVDLYPDAGFPCTCDCQQRSRNQK
ncbi:MORN repeat-containing protein 3 [Drosophila tropicalis]|uniref:MORN repeat-containing protein 3 n=1 Tax=Drosophila tropicalis TaxID=46794 RepID=UPI0035AB9C0E